MTHGAAGWGRINPGGRFVQERRAAPRTSRQRRWTSSPPPATAKEVRMREESLAFLRSLVETGAPSGFEQPVQNLYRDYVAGFAGEVHTDVLGNTIATLNAEGRPRVMLAGHADEIGFL